MTTCIWCEDSSPGSVEAGAGAVFIWYHACTRRPRWCGFCRAYVEGDAAYEAHVARELAKSEEVRA